MIAVLAVGTATRLMLWSVFSFLLRAPVFFRMFRHLDPPYAKIPCIVTISRLGTVYAR